jgi:hypothetical protein
LVEVTALADVDCDDVPLVALLVLALVVEGVVVAVADVPDDVPVELVPVVPLEMTADAFCDAEATDVVPLPWPTAMAPTNDPNDASVSALNTTRVFTPCLRRRLRRTSGASAAVPRRSCSRRMRSARSSGVISLMSCSVPSIV